MFVHAVTCVMAGVVASVAPDVAATPKMSLYLMDNWDPILLWQSFLFHSP